MNEPRLVYLVETTRGYVGPSKYQRVPFERAKLYSRFQDARAMAQRKSVMGIVRYAELHATVISEEV